MKKIEKKNHKKISRVGGFYFCSFFFFNRKCSLQIYLEKFKYTNAIKGRGKWNRFRVNKFVRHLTQFRRKQ